MKRLILILLWAVGALAQTATQHVLNYTAGNTTQCTIEVSTSASYTPLIHAVDETLFANAGHDGQSNASARQFVVGQKWIAQENVASVATTGITVINGTASRTSNLVTVNYTSQPFVAGDNITITNGNPAIDTSFLDSWARVQAVTTNSFVYEVFGQAAGTVANTASLIIKRADRYSLALAANTQYFYRVGGVSNTCSASGTGMPTGSFTTENIPNGNTWEEGPVRDNNGLQISPTIFESRVPSVSGFIDALTGAQITRVTLFEDANNTGSGWASSFYRPCSLTTSANGYFYCNIGLGQSSVGGMYAIKPDGTAHWLGITKGLFTDSGNHTCCQQNNDNVGPGNSTGSTTAAATVYGLGYTNAGIYPAHTVLLATTFNGNDNADAATGAVWSVTGNASVNLTPEPSSTLDQLFVAYDASYDPSLFACAAIETFGDYVIGNCDSLSQGSPSWVWAFQISTKTVKALGGEFKNPQCRWCGTHGTGVLVSGQWTSASTTYTTSGQQGMFEVSLASPMTSASTSVSVTAPSWSPNFKYWNVDYAGPFPTGTPSNTNGNAIVDSNGNLEVCALCNSNTPGTSGATVPVWNLTLGGTTNDGNMVWTNRGPASHLNEPQNVYARTKLDGSGNYWSYLQSVAGAVAGGNGGLAGGHYNGDLFHFEDGTNECIRIVTTPTTSGTWTSITRAVNGNSSQYCLATTPQAHAVGALLRALCENASEVASLTSFYWDWLDDPHMSDATNTFFVQSLIPAAHGNTRQPPPEGNFWNTFVVTNTHNPFIAADMRGSPTFSLSSQLTFDGLVTSSNGVTHQDYTTWDFEAATFKDSEIGSLYFVTGGAYGTMAKVAGTTSIYRYAFGGAPFNRTIPYIPNSSGTPGTTIADISGPGSLLTDASATATACIVSVAGECWAGSTVGQAYANIPSPVSSASLVCNNSGENNSYLGPNHDLCIMNTATFNDALNQYGLLVPGTSSPCFLGLYQGNQYPQYGACNSRRLAQNALGGIRMQNLHPHVIPDGSGALFESCIGDTHQNLQVNQADLYGCQVFRAVIPPQPSPDGLDRTNYLTLPLVFGSPATAIFALVKYGYIENEPIRGPGYASPTSPNPFNFYCAQYRSACYINGSASTPSYTTAGATQFTLGTTHNIKIAVPQRVLGYQILYCSALPCTAGNGLVGTPLLQFVSADSAAIGGPAVSFLSGPVTFGSVNVGSSSSPTSVTVTNTGSASLILGAGAVTLSGSNPGDFSLSSDLCSSHTVTAGSTCTFSVTFTPTAGGSRSASMNVTGNASGSNSVSGTGVSSGAPSLVVTPSPVAFGSVTVSTPSALSVTVTNTGTAAQTFTTLTITGTNAADFVKSNDLCSGQTIQFPPASNTCTLTITFTPGAAGSRSATLNIPGTVSTSASLTGTGTSGPAPIITITPNPGAFGSVNVGSTSSPLTFTLTNTGNANEVLGASAVTCSTADATMFCPLNTDNCSNQTVAFPPSQNTCTVSLDFNPTSGGAKTTNLVFTGTVNATIPLTGTGIAGSPGIAFTPLSPMNFPLTTVNTSSAAMTLTVTNNGSAPLILSAAGTIASDAFNRASLGANWTATVGTFNILSSTSVQVATTGGGSHAAMYWNANTIPNDNTTCLTMTTVGNASSAILGPALRMSTSAISYYWLVDYGGNLSIQLLNAGSASNLTTSAFTPANGDVFCLQASGSNFTGTVTRSSTVVATVTATDTTLATGGSGIAGYGSVTPLWEGTPWSVASNTSPAVTLTGTNAGDFSFIDHAGAACSGQTIAPFATCKIDVTFTPTVIGSRTALLTVRDTTNNVSGNVTLNGTGGSGVTGAMGMGGVVVLGGKVVIH